MARGKFSFPEPLFDRLRQAQEPNSVRNMGATFSHILRYLFLCPAEMVHQFLVGSRLFQGIEVSPLDILDDGDFQRLGVGQVPYYYRHVVELGHLGCPPSPFARYNLVNVRAEGPYEDGRENTFLPDGSREF